MTKRKFALLGAVGTAVLALGASCVLTLPAQATPRRTIDLAIGNDGVVQTDVGAPGLSVGDESPSTPTSCSATAGRSARTAVPAG
ncbi:hypothetical protein ACF061_16495 [Streptomyces sp. NPDC015220]|uniref:hypothetical protein n=1 Tax=Streptomyces sp. NPDC015220 TaxID=3364947 RepID=UPI0036FE6E04